MTLSLIQTYTACGPGLNVSFAGIGGTEPYVYSVLASPTAAGGTINSSSGIYTSPSSVPASVNNAYDVIQVTDSLSNIATSQILIGSPLILFCNILQNQLNLLPGHLFIWDQKLVEPIDYDLYIAVSVLYSKPFGNTNYWNGLLNQTIQSINVLDTLQIDIISRGPAARDNKEKVLMALNSQYSEQQQEFNSFYIGKLPYGANFNNLSQIDGAAIPYRYQIQVTLQYFVKLIQSVNYYDTFEEPTVIVNS